MLKLVLRLVQFIVAVVVGRLQKFFRWCPSSRQCLDEAEKRLLAYMNKPYRGFYVDVGRVGENAQRNSRVWTVVLEADDGPTDRLPLVLVHGYLCGSALWLLNLEALSKHRRVYSVDMLGFGKSSRPPFSTDAHWTERQLVQGLESWRKKVGLERFVLLGHSMGGFVAAAYALRHPQHVVHLIIEDPWGFTKCGVHKTPLRWAPWLVDIFTRGIKFFSRADICTLLRAGGILGPPLLAVVLSHEIQMFSKVVNDRTAIPSYFYHCNVRRPSGEAAVKALMHQFPWARHPMGPRVVNLPRDMAITFIYGENSFMGKHPAFKIMEARAPSYVNIHVLRGCGHNLHYEKPAKFNQVVCKACEHADAQVQHMHT